MAKKKKQSPEAVVDFDKQNIVQIQASELMTGLMLIHGANTNLARAFPEIFSGLKPVGVRLLYDMYSELKLFPEKARTKVASIAGDTMGKFHPHGDAGDVIIGMGQYWTNPYPYIDPKGNFGTEFGHDPGSPRYIEGRLSEYAMDCFFTDWDPELIEFVKAYNIKYKEPTFLPSAYPNLLINGSNGIGWSIMCGIPPHNFNEVCGAVMTLMKNPKAKVVLYPDLPTGGEIIDKDKFEAICKDGIGSFRHRGSYEIMDNGDIHFTSIPYGTSGVKILQTIKEKYKEGLIDGIRDIRNPSKTSIDLYIEVKKGHDPQDVLQSLFRHTALQDSFTVSYKVSSNFKNYNLNIRGYLLDWIDFRRNYKRSKLANQIAKLHHRMHVLEGLITILESPKCGEYMEAFRKAKNRSAIIDILINKIKLSDIQADTIADMKIYQLSKDNLAAFKEELKTKKESVVTLEGQIKDDEYIDLLITNELAGGMKKYGRPRQTVVRNIEAFEHVPDSCHTIVFTKQGMVKKLDSDVDSIGTLNQGDIPITILKASNRDSIMLFDSAGKVFSLPVHAIKSNALDHPGFGVHTICKTAGRIIYAINKPSDKFYEEKGDKLSFIFVTKNGIVKRTLLKHYNIVSQAGILALGLNPDDELIDVRIVTKKEDILLYTNDGMGLRINAGAISEYLRNAKGVKGIDIDTNSYIVGMTIIKKEHTHLFMLSESGMGKKCDLATVDTCKRAKAPINLITLKDENVLAVRAFIDGVNKLEVYFKDKTEVVEDTSKIIETTRISPGKKLFGVKRGDCIIDVKVV